MYLSLLAAKDSIPKDADVLAVWTGTGDVGVDHPAGVAAIGETVGQDQIGFALTEAAVRDATGCSPVKVAAESLALRIDEVAFPVGAVAHRHVHAGSGWRYLVSGALRIEAKDHSKVMMPGDFWFEPENTPVRAVALHEMGVTRFVRCMVIPESFVGASTFQLCEDADAELPRLQITHRHFDHVI